MLLKKYSPFTLIFDCLMKNLTGMIPLNIYKHPWPQILRYIMGNAWGNQYAKVIWHPKNSEDYYPYLAIIHRHTVTVITSYHSLYTGIARLKWICCFMEFLCSHTEVHMSILYSYIKEKINAQLKLWYFFMRKLNNR